MIVLVEGVSFVNKGAQLMLAAIVQQLHEASIEVAVSPYVGTFHERASYGLLQSFQVRSIGRLGPIIQAVIRPGYRKLFGLAADADCGALLDASGFFLGDQWMFSPGRRRKLYRFGDFKRSNKPIILMPQAFGPFEVNTQMSAFARDLLSLVDLVYARDECSLRYLRALVPDHPGLRLAPDFTALLKGSEPQGLRLGPAPAAVIPNNQMLVHGQIGENTYINFLAESVKVLRSNGLDPFILLHETSLDRALAAKVRSLVPDISVLEEDDARVLKGIMRHCVVTVGSRFHGLVSALSEGVPSIGTGWSHKYQALFSEFGCPECLIDLRSDGKRLATLVAELVSCHDARRQSLLERAIGIRERIRAMWSEIGQILVARAA